MNIIIRTRLSTEISKAVTNTKKSLMLSVSKQPFNVGYCIEPGVHLSMGQSMTQYDENYFNNIQANGVISGDEIRQYIGRILQYGYRGTISTSWRSQNEAAANSIAHAVHSCPSRHFQMTFL